MLLPASFVLLMKEFAWLAYMVCQFIIQIRLLLYPKMYQVPLFWVLEKR